MAWQYPHPFWWNRAAPREIDEPGGAPITEAGKSGDEKRGDHPAVCPETVRDIRVTRAIPATPTDQGRRNGLRSPLFANKGSTNSSPKKSRGPPMMTQSSRLAGNMASAPKYHRKYQSGWGKTLTCAGSGGPARSGAPIQMVNAMMPIMTMVEKTTSRHAASGQKGTPMRSS